MLFMLTLAVAVGLSSIAIGSILSTALLIGPAATALRITRSLRCGCRHGLPHRNHDDVARHPLGIRQCRSGIPRARDCPSASSSWRSSFFCTSCPACQLCVGLPGDVPARNSVRHELSGGSEGIAGWGNRLMFSGFMVNAWEVGTIVAIVAGVVGFFVVLRGSAFPAHAIPNGAFAGAAGANLIGINPLVGLGVFSLLAALGIGSLGRRGKADVATALVLVMMLALGAAFLSQSTEYEPQIFSLLFGEILGVSSSKILPVAILGLVSVMRDSGSLPAPDAQFDCSRDRHGQRHPAELDRVGLPRGSRVLHHHDCAGRWSSLDIHADDRTASRRPVLHQTAE